MSDFLDSLELSVRTTNVLRLAGVVDRERFEALTAGEVLRLRNAGRKTWAEVQEWLRGPSLEEKELMVLESLAHANMWLRDMPSHRVVALDEGKVLRLVREVFGR